MADFHEKPSPHYHPIGIFFHWLMALMVFAQLWWGWRTSFLMAGFEKADAYVVHAQLGAAILVVAFLRLGWRIIAPFVAPKLEAPEDLPGWQRLAAEVTHWLLYALMIALPVSGLIMIGSTAPETLERALGVTAFRDVDFTTRAQLEHFMERAHFVMIWGMIGLLALHIGAALKHHFVDRDDVLARMIPWLGRDRPAPEGSAARKANAAKAAR
ncbi:MAG: cytochrome b [Burkholderiales bacterium]|nr:MAG: cytochrome b [Burkholderiales bacterium]